MYVYIHIYIKILNCRSSRKSLDYTKQSLRISIDLGKREEESETWLQVGRIYYLIQEDELADMYLQVWKRVETSSLSLCANKHFSTYFIPHPCNLNWGFIWTDRQQWRQPWGWMILTSPWASMRRQVTCTSKATGTRWLHFLSTG